MSQRLKELPEVVTYVRRLENQIRSELADIVCVVLSYRKDILERLNVLKEKHTPIGTPHKQATLATELLNGEYWLVAINANGNVRYLAQFDNQADCAAFVEAFALAKASAHAAGQSGI